MHLRSEGQEGPAACALRAGPRVPGKVAVGGGWAPSSGPRRRGRAGPLLQKRREEKWSVTHLFLSLKIAIEFRINLGEGEV